MRRLLFMMFISLTFLLMNLNITMAYEKEIKSISTAMAENIANAGKKMIAVVDFTDLQGNVTELGRFLAEEFSVAFAGAGKGFEVVDRTHLKSIIAEHKLSSTGIIDPQTARKLGQIAGVDALITGTITPFGDSVRISVKILDTATAKVISASSGDIAKTKAIEELLARGIESTQPFSQQPSTSGYVPSTSGPTSKKVGDMIITIKGVSVLSKGSVDVKLGFLNQSNKKILLGAAYEPRPNLTDEKGNVFDYKEGLAIIYDWRVYGKYALTLYPKSDLDVTLHFRSKDRDINIEDIGSLFSLSFKYKIFDPKDKTGESFSASFSDIKAQKPK